MSMTLIMSSPSLGDSPDLASSPILGDSPNLASPNNTKLVASINNVSFVQPNIALLQAHFFNKVKGVFATDFPANPLIKFNNTSTPPRNTIVNNGTKAGVFPLNTSVELVVQDTSIIGSESDPLHLYGFNFFVLGQDIGNFNPRKDPAKFNLIDLAKRNTVGVPSGGWEFGLCIAIWKCTPARLENGLGWQRRQGAEAEAPTFNFRSS
ncbi:hypothetical protein GOBAR_DD36057 [Gossypium barbadense]|nr:hypothetical protein GOBAR_DD36057 [Gossypium barbadense]